MRRESKLVISKQVHADVRVDVACITSAPLSAAEVLHGAAVEVAHAGGDLPVATVAGRSQSEAATGLRMLWPAVLLRLEEEEPGRIQLGALPYREYRPGQKAPMIPRLPSARLSRSATMHCYAGRVETTRRNWAYPPFTPREIDRRQLIPSPCASTPTP